MFKARIPMLILCLAFISGCVSAKYPKTIVGPGRINISNVYSIDSPSKWNSIEIDGETYWTNTEFDSQLKTPSILDIYNRKPGSFYSPPYRIVFYDIGHGEPLRTNYPYLFRKNMSIDQIALLFADSWKQRIEHNPWESANVEVEMKNAKPEKFGPFEGFEFEAVLLKQNLTEAGPGPWEKMSRFLVSGAVINERLFMMLLSVREGENYPKYLGLFRKLLGSIQKIE